MADVTIYGRLDVGYNQAKTSRTVAGVSGWYKGNNLVNEDGLSTGLLGFKGSEDLGGGLTASFVQEMDLDLDTGTLGTGPARNATLGLSGGFGTVRLGRSYTPLFSTIGMSDPFGTTGVGAVNNFGMVSTAVRASNAVFYTSPNFGGVSVDLMLQQNNSQTQASVGSAGKSSANGLSAKYANGPLAVAFGVGTEKGTRTASPAALSAATGAISAFAFTDRLDALFAASAAAGGAASTAVAGANAKYTGQALSATYDFGVAKAFFGYSKNKDDGDTTVTGGEITIKETNLGVAMPMGAITLLAGMGKNKLTVGGAAGSLTGTDVALGATYDLSKRTTAYFKTGTSNKFSGTIAGVSGSVKTTRTSAGLRHTF